MARLVPQEAFDLVTRPNFDGLYDPDKSTALIEPYRDDAGFPTIGYGHLLSRDTTIPLSTWPAITVEQAQSLLWADLAKAGAAVLRLCPVPLSDKQYSALIDFVFNCGAGNLEVSALRKKVNREEHNEVPAQFMRWVYAGGRKLRGLVLRRQAEARLYIEGTA